MIKTEQKVVKLNTDMGITEAKLPFSLVSACGEGIKCAIAEFDLYIEERELLSRYIYLRIKDAQGINAVKVNGKSILHTVTDRSVLNCNIKDHLTSGKNTVVLEFSEREGRAAGIFGSVELLRFNTAAIDNVTVKESLEGASANLDITLDILGTQDGVRAVATVVSSSGHIYYGGLTYGKGRVTVKDPLLWWPKGMGVQNLYKVTVNLYGDMEIEDTAEFRVGIRAVTPSESDETLNVGAASMLPMGAVYKVEDRENPLLSQNRASALINSASRAGFNSLVISENDELPPDSFFDLCDVHGIAVIREIKASRLDESGELDTLSRVGHHASLVLYRIVYDTGNSKSIGERISKIAPSVAVKFVSESSTYPRALSLPSHRVSERWLTPEEHNIFSKKVEDFGRDKIIKMLTDASERYPYAGGFYDFTYVSGVSSAEKIKSEMLSARINRGKRAAIYDALGDVRDGISTSGIDSSCSWGALHYCASKFFAPVVIKAEHLGGGRVAFSVSNEKRQSFVGNIEYRIITNENRTLFSASEGFTAERSSSLFVCERDFSEYINGHECEYYLEYQLKDALGVYSRDTLLFVPEKHFTLLDPKIKTEIIGSERRFTITVSAENFAKSVAISFADCDAVFFDNYFDITSTAPIKIPFTLTGGIETPEHLKRVLRVKSMYEIKKL